MPAEDLLKEIRAKSAKNVKEKLKKEKVNAKYVDPKNKAIYYYPLHAAINTGSPSVVEALLDGGADVNAVDSAGDQALHVAAALPDGGNPVAIVGALIKKKASVGETNNEEKTPLHIAAEKGSVELTKVLAQAGKEFLEADGPGYTALLGAVKKGCMAAVGVLVEAGAKITAKDSDGLTPLLHCVISSHTKDALDLLSKGDCGIDEVDPKGYSALMLVCGCGGTEGEVAKSTNMELVQKLLLKGASPDIQAGPDKNTVIMDAIKAKKSSLAMTLMKPSKKINAKNSKKETALSLAMASGDDELISSVLAAGADVSVDGPTMMKRAMDDQKDGLVKELVILLKPLQLDKMDMDFKKLLEQKLPLAAVAYLQRFDDDIAGNHTIDDEGNTQLHMVSELGASYDICVTLMKLGLNPKKVNKAGDTPLHVAARCGHVEVCRALLDGGANAIARNMKNKTARSQPKIPECTKDFLLDPEEDAKHNKNVRAGAIWDDMMKSTQTENACIMGVL